MEKIKEEEHAPPFRRSNGVCDVVMMRFRADILLRWKETFASALNNLSISLRLLLLLLLLLLLASFCRMQPLQRLAVIRLL